MSLLVSQFREERAKDKKNTYEEARTPFAFKTGIDLLDYKNGKYVVPGEGKPYYSLGIDEGTYIMLIGKSGSGKTTIALQIAGNIIRPYDEGAIFIDDIEGATDKTRIKNITGWSSQEVREKVVHRNTGITSESFYKNIDSIYQSKMKLVEEYGTQYTIETDKVDEYGEPIIILPPTVYILDSLALLSPEKISEEEELSGRNCDKVA